MKSRWLQMLLFAAFLLAAIVTLRFALRTVPGIVVLAGVLLVRLLWFLYWSMHTLTITLWDASGNLADAVLDARSRHAEAKEAPHAAGLL